MNQQLQQIGKLNLDLRVTTSKFDRVRIVNSARNERFDRTQTKGWEFVKAIEAKFDGSRPIAEDVIFATLEPTALKAGRSWLDIQHRRNPEARQKPYYATSITNRSTERIRIDRFGTYVLIGKTLVLHSITGGFFGRQQFQEWYNLGESQWIEPGQTVTDPNNHSNLGVYWAYLCTTDSGKEFVAGAAWNGKPWWKFW
jgi:hypothetical protein